MSKQQDNPDPVGRPTKYKPEFCSVAKKMAQLGATDPEIAEALDVNLVTMWRWRSTFPEFSKSLKAGKEECDERVERSLYMRAVGYDIDSEKIFHHDGKIKRAPTKIHIPPDTGANTLWLKNRKPKEWRDKQNLEIAGTDDGPIQVQNKVIYEVIKHDAPAED